jgi:hypothetical protein
MNNQFFEAGSAEMVLVFPPDYIKGSAFMPYPEFGQCPGFKNTGQQKNMSHTCLHLCW